MVTHRLQVEAILALANIKDTETYSKVLDWFHGADEMQRNLAIDALETFNTDEARQILQDSYASGGRNENDKAALAVALLGLGNRLGSGILKETVYRAEGS